MSSTTTKKGCCFVTENNKPQVRDHYTHPWTMGDKLAVALLILTMALLGAFVVFSLDPTALS
ncbi:MAG: hypothetical protein CK431_10265 [Mycobacterium sp.]|nr:MAG: hypothetical protein CK431_10265 [Mycobacterium sp.]